MIRKIRLNPNNFFYAREYLNKVLRNDAISVKNLRTELLDLIASSHQDLGISETDEKEKKIDKLNDTLYTYSYQFFSSLNINIYHLQDYVIPNYLSELFHAYEDYNELKSSDLYKKTLVLSDLRSNKSILNKKSNMNEIKKEVLNDYEKAGLLIKDGKYFSINEPEIHRISQQNIWTNKKDFFNRITIEQFIEIVEEHFLEETSIRTVSGLISRKFKTLDIHVIDFIKRLPPEYKGKIIRFKQPMTNSIDAIKIGPYYYNRLKIENQSKRR